jgi:hypothetical protein
MELKDIVKAIDSGKTVRISEQSDMYNKFTKGRKVTRIANCSGLSDNVIAIVLDATPPYEINVSIPDLEIIDKTPDTFMISGIHQSPMLYSRSPNERKKISDSKIIRDGDILKLFNSFGFKVIMSSDKYHPHFYIVKGELVCMIPMSLNGENYFIVQDKEYEPSIKTQISYNKDLKSKKYIDKLVNIFNNILAHDIKKHTENDFKQMIRSIPEIETNIPNVSVFMSGMEDNKVLVRIMDNTIKTGLNSDSEIIRFHVDSDINIKNIIPTKANKEISRINKHTTNIEMFDSIVKVAMDHRDMDMITYSLVVELVKDSLLESGVFIN